MKKITLLCLALLGAVSAWAETTELVEVYDWDDLWRTLQEGKSVKLMHDIEQEDDYVDLSGNQVVTIDLNGRELMKADCDWLFVLTSDNCQLTITDSAGGGLVTYNELDRNYHCEDTGSILVQKGHLILDKGTFVGCCQFDDGGFAYIASTGKMTINGGTIRDCYTCRNAGAIANYGTLTMNGGTVTDCESAYEGGAIRLYTGSVFTMNGGVIQNCEASSGYGGSVGGAIANYGGTLTINDGTISGCTASDNGGAIYSFNQDGTASTTINGGTISGCSATYGGAILLNSGCVFTMTNGVIQNCSVSCNGGAICNSGGTLVMSGGTISGCSAPGMGGAIQNENQNGTGNATINGGTISGCTASDVGGGICNRAPMTINGGTISGCTASDVGGGIYNDVTLTINGGTISGCTATHSGGGINNDATLTMNGGTISGCRANTNNGGAIQTTKGSETEIYGGSFLNNYAAGYGGAVSADEAEVNFYGGYFSGNTAGIGMLFFDGDGDNVRGNLYGCVVDGYNPAALDPQHGKCDCKLADGVQSVAVGSFYVIGRNVTSRDGKLTGGTFTFDPNEKTYSDGGLKVAVYCVTTKDSEGTWTVSKSQELVSLSSWAEIKESLEEGAPVQLAADIAQADVAVELNDGQVVTFDLNGHSVQRVGKVRVFSVYNSTLTIKDSAGNGRFYPDSTLLPYRGAFANLTGTAQLILESGTIDGFSANGEAGTYDEGAGGAFEVQSGSTLTMNGGAIKNCAANTKGGAVDVLSGGTFAMNGGVITNCSASTNGGAINNAGTLTISGGTIRDCTASGTGSAIRAEGSSSVATINGGVILNSAAGGTIVTDGTAKVTVNGSVFDDEGMLDNGADLGDDWELNGIGSTANFVIGRNVEFEGDKVKKGIFTFDPSKPEYAAAGLLLKDGADVCANSDGTYAVNTIASWAQLKEALEAGESVRLGSNITQDSDEITLSANQVVKLDLKGFTLTAASGKRAFNLNSSGCELTITNSGAEATGKVTRGDSYSGDGGIVYVSAGHLIVNGGTFTGKANNGGFAYVAKNARLTMGNGTLTGCEASNDGGAFYVYGHLTVNGGTIANCKATNNGGALISWGETVIDAGTISQCSASWGGAVYARDKNLTVNGGTISDCTASLGGTFYVNEGDLVVNGGVYEGIQANGFYNASGSCKIKGGVFDKDCSSSTYFHGVTLQNTKYTFTGSDSATHYLVGSNVTLTDNQIVRGTFTFDPSDAEYAAAGLTLGSVSTVYDNGDGTYAVKTPWDVLKESILAGGTVKLSGNVTQDNDEIALTGNEVITLDLNGHTLTSAAGKRLFNLNSSECCLTITNSAMIASGVITCSDVLSDKGGIAYVASGHLILNAGVFTGKSSTDGGFAYVCGTGRVTMNGGKLVDCTSGFDGGAFYVKEGEITMNGGAITNCVAGNDSGAIHATNGRVTVNGGTISYCRTKSTGNAITLNASTLTMNGGVVECADGAPIAAPSGGTATLNGGVFDEENILGEGIALGEGWTLSAVGTTGLYIIGMDVVVNDNRIAEGTFTFNPRGGEYFKAGLPLAAWTVAEKNADGTYTLKVVDGKTFYVDVNGTICLFKTQNGAAVLGDGTTNAVDTATTILTIPHFATGLLVTDIAPNAFKDCSSLKYIFFDDAPLASAGGATFADSTVGVYRPSLASLWEPILEDGKWMDVLKMEKKYCETWSKLCDNLSCGVDAQLVRDISQDGATAVFAGGAATLTLGTNRLNGVEGMATIRAASGTLSVYDGWFSKFSAEEAGGTLALCGGIFDEDQSDWIADGYESVFYNRSFLVAKADTFATNNDSEMTRGAFTFNSDSYKVPRADYTGISTLTMVTPTLYIVGIPNDTIFTETIAGVDCTVKIVSGSAQIGDGTNPAIDTSTTRFGIPAKICGYAVTNIAAKAFTDCANLKYLLFEGNPPTLEDGAIPSGTVISYLAENRAAWEAEIVDGKWHGLTASYETCAFWQKVCDNLAHGENVRLLDDLEQDGAAAVPSGAPYLDLAGHTLTQAAGVSLVSITNGATLTISNVITATSTVTNGWVIGAAGETPTFAIAIGGELTVAGGNYTNASFYADGHADILGGVWHGANMFARGADGALHVYGGIFNEHPIAYLPAGVFTLEYAGKYLVLKNDGHGIDDNGCFYSGGFTFDPSAADYAKAGLKIAPNTAISTEAGDPTIKRIVPLDDEVTYWAHLPEADVRFTVEDNVAILGDGSEAIVTNLEIGSLSIPAKLAGFPVGVINANAFKDVKALTYLEFQGPPVETVQPGAFTGPTNLIETWYTGDYADEWLGALAGGTTWQGLTMTRGAKCRTWKGLCRNILDGYPVQIAAIVKQGDGDLAFGTTITNKIDVGENALILTRQLATVPDERILRLSGSEKGLILGGQAATGGCVRVSAGGVLETTRSHFVGARADVGGAIAVDAGGRFAMTEGRIGGARATRGAAIAAAGSVTIDGGTLACNVATDEAAGGGLYVAAGGSVEVKTGTFQKNTGFGGAIHNAGGLVTVWDGAFEGNLAADGEQGSLAVVTDGGTNVVYGGTYLCHTGTPVVFSTGGAVCHYGSVADTPIPSAVEGYEETQVGDLYVTHVAGTFATCTNDEIMVGTFTFDPRGEEYKAVGLEVLPETTVTVAEGTPTFYTASISEGGPYVKTIDGVEWTYCVINDKAVLGDGEHAARTGGSETALSIPGWVNGFQVNGIDKKAFTGFANLKDIVFDGLPPESMSGEAFDGGVGSITGSYRPEYAAEWKKVIANGSWKGITMVAGRCLDWDAVRGYLLAGTSVSLLGNMAQTGGAIELSSGSVTLDLNGYTVSGEAGSRVFKLSGSAELTIADAGQAGGFTGRGTCEEAGGFAFVEDGTLTLKGGTIANYVSELNGGAVFVNTNGTVEVEGGSVTGCSAANGGAFAVTGTMTIEDGEITSSSASANGGAIFLEAKGKLVILDGTITGCTASQDGAGICSYGALTRNGGTIRNCAASGKGGAIAVSGGIAALANGVAKENIADGGSTVSAAGGAIVRMTGGRYEGSDEEKTHGILIESGVTYKLYGGIFKGAAPETGLQTGWAKFEHGGDVIVAQEYSLSWLGDLLTAGVFTFDPSGADLVSDPYKQIVTATGGTPATWTLSVNFVVTCYTWQDLRANIQVGNKVVFGYDYNPPRQKKIPNGFVYRGRVLDGDDPAANLDDLKVTINIYALPKGGKALWTGVKTNVRTDTNGTFQVWVEDAIRTSGATNLVQLFSAGQAGYLGIAFDDGDECSPRRALITAPIANRSDSARVLDDTATVGILDARGGLITCETLNLAGAVCGTLEFTTTNTAFNVAEMNVGGVKLYRHAENRIVSRHAGTWVYRHVEPGDLLIYNASKSGLLTIQSTNDCSVPLLTFPIPSGATFFWRSTPFDGRYRLTTFGD